MTQRDSLKCVHEPFGDAFYYGSERLSSRYEDDLAGREGSGFTQSTYRTVLDRFQREASEGKRLVIKDMAYYLTPPDAAPASIAPSVGRVKRGVGTVEAVEKGTTNGTTRAPYPYNTDAEPNNPTVIPRETLGNFHFTFLIRHPRSSIPSYYRCCVPPLDKVTGFYEFMPSEAGYYELRQLFDYLRSIGQVGREIAGQKPDAGLTPNGVQSNGLHTPNGAHLTNGVHSSNGDGPSNGVDLTNGIDSSNGESRGVEVCVIDADDLLDNPAGLVEAFCKSTGIDYTPGMLDWSTEADQQQAEEAFRKWKKKIKSIEAENAEWTERFGEKGAKVIRETVDKNVEDYEYLKAFAIKI
ncbi:MAG: hypothetical protein Q9168_000013 [Polycauliona sp. 1 TL-2023]